MARPHLAVSPELFDRLCGSPFQVFFGLPISADAKVAKGPVAVGVGIRTVESDGVVKFIYGLRDSGQSEQALAKLAAQVCPPAQLGRVHIKRSASKMSANEMNPRKITSSFSKREKMRRNPFNRRNSLSISLRLLYISRSYSHG